MESEISYFKTIQILVLWSALRFALYLSYVSIQAGLNLYLKDKRNIQEKKELQALSVPTSSLLSLK